MPSKNTEQRFDFSLYFLKAIWYTGRTPVFIEDTIFEIIIPMDSVANLQVGPEKTDRVDDKVNDRVNNKVNETEKILLSLLKENPKYTVTQLADKLNVSRKTIANRLKILKEKNLIKRIGSSREGYWKIM